MDYEKAYKEALERERADYNNHLEEGYKNYREHLEAIFPQLRESEDERIRKYLIEELKVAKSVGELKFAIPQPTREDCIAYLEKQKERGPLTKDEEYILHRIIEYLEDETCPSEWISLLHDIYCLPYPKQKEQKPVDDKAFEEWLDDWYQGSKEAGGDVVMSESEFKNWSRGIRNMYEQKPELVKHPPITYTYNSNASRDERLKAALLALLNSDLLNVKEGGYFTKQDLIEWVERIPTDKPAEWSEEDSTKIGTLSSIIFDYAFHKDTLDENNDLTGEYAELDDWLKALPERFNLQPKPEWSEEDKQWLSEVYFAIDHSMYSDEEKRAMKKYVDSLRPSWKPSEEQMMKDAVEYEVGMHGEPIKITFDKYVQRAMGIFPGDKVRIIIVKE